MRQISMEGIETGWTKVQAARTRRKRSDQGVPEFVVMLKEDRVESQDSPD